ncbi:MAG: GNAT family N-acetyltransferase [Bacteroidetes bacterium]|nr:MAG: GNAT family N-acetyltransferase [Bacteroidota bacterium]
MSDLEIRFAGNDDVAAIASISLKTFFDTFAEYNTPENMDSFMNDHFSETRLSYELEDPSNIFLIAEIEKRLVGYAKLSESPNPNGLDGVSSIEICRIYSIKDMIGKGVGKSLMQKSIDIARERNKKVIWLGVWEHNPKAVEFYTKWGFERFGEHPFILGDDIQTDWLMKKEVS